MGVVEAENWIQNQYITLTFQCFLGILILIALYIISLNNYLLFHGIVELVGIAIAFSIFILVWNTRKLLPDAFFLIIGISLLFTGGLDLIHTLAFKGMGVFSGNSADLPTQSGLRPVISRALPFLLQHCSLGGRLRKTGNLTQISSW